MLDASHPDVSEIDKAKKLLKVVFDLNRKLLAYCLNSFALKTLL